MDTDTSKPLIIIPGGLRYFINGQFQTVLLPTANSLKMVFLKLSFAITDHQFISKEFLGFSNAFGFVYLTSSPHHHHHQSSTRNGEAKHVFQTVENPFKKASDPYIVLINYRSAPFQHSKSPAELLMNTKLRIRILTISHKKYILPTKY